MFSNKINKEGSKFILNLLSKNYVTKTKNLYEILGLTPNATQADIKSAYYKLSKAYHPDLNPNDSVANEKFRAISEAYEVLGTYRLRKMYDKGIIHRAGSEFSHHSGSTQKTQPYDIEEEINDDDTTRFYKSRLKREHTGGKSKIYDFDEWTSQHYGETFRYQQNIRNREATRKRREEYATSSKLNRNTLITVLGMGLCFIIIIDYIINHTSLDINKLDKNEKERK
ncbi:hypothetical protein PVAND_011695 [Polypedilum vanderplanki]|uniref:J domain-containing protein n=1 Tax=Polypedilum vanderplanki TaxID=319348 RepID=A0A9J6CK86_POLVA|nr:hypothetical protein PVAND_011695 [Polypedilum vanderplanki]